MKKISKNEARVRFFHDETIYLIPCKHRIGEIYLRQAITWEHKSTMEFEDKVRDFERNVCSSALGRYPYYYVL